MSVSGLIANSTNQLKALELTQQAPAATEQEQDQERVIQIINNPAPPRQFNGKGNNNEKNNIYLCRDCRRSRFGRLF